MGEKGTTAISYRGEPAFSNHKILHHLREAWVILLLLLEGGHPLLRDFSSSSMELLGSVVCLLVGESPLIANRPIDYKLMDWLTNGC